MATELYDKKERLMHFQNQLPTFFEKDENQNIKFKDKNTENFLIENPLEFEVNSQNLFAKNTNFNLKDKMHSMNLFPLNSIKKISTKNDLILQQSFYNSYENSYLLQLIFKIYGKSNESQIKKYLKKHKMTSFEENENLIKKLKKNLNFIQNAIDNLKANIKSIEIEKIKQNADDILTKIANIKLKAEYRNGCVNLKKKLKILAKMQISEFEVKNSLKTIKEIIKLYNSLNINDILRKQKNQEDEEEEENEIDNNLSQMKVSVKNIENINMIDEINIKLSQINDEESVEEFIRNLNDILNLIKEIKEKNSNDTNNSNEDLLSEINNFENNNANSAKIQFLINNVIKLPSILDEKNTIETLIKNFLLNDFFGVIKYCNDNIQNQFIINALIICIKFIKDEKISIASQFNATENKSFAQKNLIIIFNSCFQKYPSILDEKFYNNILYIIKNFQFDENFPIEFLNQVLENSSENTSFSKEIFTAILNNPNLLNLSFEIFEKILNSNIEHIKKNCLNSIFSSSFDSNNPDYSNKKILALKYNCTNDISANEITNITIYFSSENQSNSNLKFSSDEIIDILNQINDLNIPYSTFDVKKIKILAGLNYSHFWNNISDINKKAICFSELPTNELVKIYFYDYNYSLRKYIINDDICKSIYIDNAHLFLNKLSKLKIEDFENEFTEIFIKDFFEYNLFDLSKYIFENKEHLSSIIKYLFHAFAYYEHEFKTQENQMEKNELKKFLLGNFNYCIEQNLFDENNETNEEEEENNNLLLKKHYAQEIVNAMNAYNIELLNQELNKYKYFLSKEFLGNDNDSDNDNNEMLQKLFNIINFKTISPQNFKIIKLTLNKNNKIKFSDEQLQDISENENLSGNLIKYFSNDAYEILKKIIDKTNLKIISLENFTEIKEKLNENNKIKLSNEQLQDISENENLSENLIDFLCDYYNIEKTDYYTNKYKKTHKKFNTFEKKLALYDIKSINLLSLDDIEQIKQNKFKTNNYNKEEILVTIEKLVKNEGNKTFSQEIIKIIGVGIYYKSDNRMETYDFILPYLDVFFYEVEDKIEFIDENSKQEIAKLKLQKDSCINNFFDKFNDNNIKFAYLSKFPLKAIITTLFNDNNIFDDNKRIEFVQNYSLEILSKLPELSSRDFNKDISEFFDFILPQYLFNILNYMFENQNQLSIFDNLFSLILNYINNIFDELSENENDLINKIEIPENESTYFEFTNLLFKVFNYCINNNLLIKQINASNFSRVIFEILYRNDINLINYKNNGEVVLINKEIINNFNEKSITELMKVFDLENLNKEIVENGIAILNTFNNLESNDENNSSEIKLTKTQFDNIINNDNFSSLPIAILNYVLIYSEYAKEEIKNKNLCEEFDSNCDNYNGKILLLIYLDLINFQQDYIIKIAEIIETYSSTVNEQNKNRYFSKKNINKIKNKLDEAKRKFEIENNKKAKQKAEQEKLAKEKQEEQKKADRKAKEEAKRKAKEEANRKAKEEAERKAKEEANRKAKEEANRKAKEEAERKAKEAERKAREKAERKAKEKTQEEEEEEKSNEKQNVDNDNKIKPTMKNDKEINNDKKSSDNETNQDIKNDNDNKNDNEIENPEQKVLQKEEKPKSTILNSQTYNYYKNHPQEFIQFLVERLEENENFGKCSLFLRKFFKEQPEAKKIVEQYLNAAKEIVKQKKETAKLEQQNISNLEQENNDNDNEPINSIDLNESNQNQIVDLSETSDEISQQMQNNSDKDSSSATNSKQDRKPKIKDINPIQTTTLRKFLLELKKILPYIGLPLGITSGLAAIAITILTFVIPIIGQIFGISLLATFFAIAMASIPPSAIKIKNNKPEKSSVENSEPEISIENPNNRPSLRNSFKNVQNFSNDKPIPQLGNSETKSEIQKENGEP